MSSMVLFDKSSNRPSQSRSVIRKWADVVTLGGTSKLMRVGEQQLGIVHMKAGLTAVRENGEAAITGGILGALAATTGLDQKGVAIDLATAGAGALGSVAMAGSEFGNTLRVAGLSGMAIFACRKTEDWMKERKASVHGEESDYSDDPIMQAANGL